MLLFVNLDLRQIGGSIGNGDPHDRGQAPAVQPAGYVSSVEWARADVVVVALQGELDVATVPAVSQCLLQVIVQRPRRLGLGLGLSVFGSTAVWMLVMAHGELAPAGWLSLIGVAGNKRVSRVLDLAGVRMLAPEYSDLTAALRELDAAEESSCGGATGGRHNTTVTRSSDLRRQ